MDLKKFLVAWSKYQLSLNWMNILFRYAVKLLLLLNLIVIVISVTHEFKSVIGQFSFLIAVLALTDLILKSAFPKKRQDLPAFQVLPNGVFFLKMINVLQDIFSPRNFVLPLIAYLVFTILGHPITLQWIVCLFIIALLNTFAAGFTDKTKKLVAATVALVLISVILIFNSGNVVRGVLAVLSFLLMIYFRYREKVYPEEKSILAGFTNSLYSVGNPFLWLDLQILKKSRHLQLAFVKIVAICLLYGYLITVKFGPENGFALILLIQVYYSIAPLLLVPYILASSHSHIGLLMTVPDMKSFFMTKLNVILVIQFLLTLILQGLNCNNMQMMFLISAVCIFNVFIVTPAMFMVVLLTDEKIDVFDSGINNILYIPPFVQSIYFLVVLVCTGVVLYGLQTAGTNVFLFTSAGLCAVVFFQRERFLRFFLSRYHKKKYKLLQILSGR